VLQVVDILLQFFNNQNNENTRHLVFKSVFRRRVGGVGGGVGGGGASSNDVSAAILSELISLAVGLQSSNVLDSAAAWIQTEVVLRHRTFYQYFSQKFSINFSAKD